MNFFCDTFQINNPQRWWPNGYGEAKLYHFQTNVSQGEEKYEEEFKIGLREVELINEEDSIGESFYFKINGKL